MPDLVQLLQSIVNGIGLGLMLFALGLMTQALHAAESGATFPLVMSGLAGDPILALGVAALLTWACHSSVAVVLLVMSLAGAQVVPPIPEMTAYTGWCARSSSSCRSTRERCRRFYLRTCPRLKSTRSCPASSRSTAGIRTCRWGSRSSTTISPSRPSSAAR